MKRLVCMVIGHRFAYWPGAAVALWLAMWGISDECAYRCARCGLERSVALREVRASLPVLLPMAARFFDALEKEIAQRTEQPHN